MQNRLTEELWYKNADIKNLHHIISLLKAPLCFLYRRIKIKRHTVSSRTQIACFYPRFPVYLLYLPFR